MSPRRVLPPGVRRHVWASGTVTFEARWYDVAGRRHSESYDTAAEADRARQEHLRQRRRGGSGDPTGGRVTLAAWHEQWVSARLVAINTKARDESIWCNQIEPAFGGVRLADLSRSAVAMWVAELTRELAPATVVRSLAVLRKMLADAVLEELISINPAASVALPKPERIERRFLSFDEIRRLEEAIEPWWNLVVVFAATTGLRIGEIAALKVGDLVLASREVHVRATAIGVTRRISGADARRQVHRPKTAAGDRVVPTITDELAERLAEHIDDRGLGLTDWLFAGRHGGPMSTDTWRARIWRPAVERAGLADPKPTPHALRHTAVALWIGAGADRYTVSRWAGHTDASFTERIYGHLWHTDHTETRAAIAELLGGRASVQKLRRQEEA